LSGAEAEAVRHDGVVLTDDTAPSFHVGYTALFRAHQPVYVTADALLHAWHASYDAILARLEEVALAPMLQGLVDDLRAALAARRQGADDPSEVRADVDTYLAVAAALASGAQVTPTEGADPAQVAEIVAKAERADGTGTLVAFGGTYDFDYSMLKPRGHYTRSERLQRYFRASSWLGRVEARIALRGPIGEWKLDRRALAGAGLLRSLVSSGAATKWQTLDSTVGALVGPPDSMSLPGFDAALRTLGAPDAKTAMARDDAAVLAAFLPLSHQRIGTQLLHPEDGTASFVLLGQRYVFDSHVFSAVTYGGLHEKRMMPSPLDVAYAALGSSAARTLLAREIATYGDEYARALDAMHRSADASSRELWNGSVYHMWLGALRTLSPDAARDAGLPAPLAGDAWNRRLLNTQLASWAELRHDNLLYAKQSITAEALCDYPHGYVDPYPAFYSALEAMAHKARDTFVAVMPGASGGNGTAAYFDRFAEVARRLRAMAEMERRNEPLVDDDLDYLDHMVSIDGRHAGCTMVAEPGGWFAGLYYDPKDVLWHRPTIADVHTQPTDEAGNPVGRVLHVGTARPRMMVVTIAHDGGAESRTYRGFVSTYAEVTTEAFRRYTDEEWELEVGKHPPPSPAWLAPIVVP
jgi:hypothetical protein